MRQVAVLFAHAHSVYKQLPGTDVWDEHPDATADEIEEALKRLANGPVL